jgi:hypothetical protein
MNPRNYTKPSDLMKKWDMSNLLEYKDVMTERLNDFQMEYKDESSSIIDYNLIPYEIERIKNLLVVVNDEISSRNS